MLCRDLEWCQTYEHLSEHHGLSGLGHTVYREDTIKSTKTFMEFDFLMIFGLGWFKSNHTSYLFPTIKGYVRVCVSWGKSHYVL